MWDSYATFASSLAVLDTAQFVAEEGVARQAEALAVSAQQGGGGAGSRRGGPLPASHTRSAAGRREAPLRSPPTHR